MAECSSGLQRGTRAGAAPPGYTAPSSPRRSLTPPVPTCPPAALVVSVVITLLVYWLAEQYAELLGEQAEGGQLPGWASIREALAATWPMVSASFAPIVALLLARLAGASAFAAANVGLAAAIVLLTIHGWSAGRAAQLRRWKLFFATSVAAALGLLMIALKDLVLIHLH